MDKLWFLIEFAKELLRKLANSPEYIQQHQKSMFWVAFGLIVLFCILFPLNDQPKRSYPPERKGPPN